MGDEPTHPRLKPGETDDGYAISYPRTGDKKETMNKRITILRNQSQQATPRISAERALLVTEFYKSDLAQQVSIPVKRAMAFRH
ncbi:MAG: hypothetical protein DRI89_14285, partial [Bacteroidetes bacterium]